MLFTRTLVSLYDTPSIKISEWYGESLNPFGTFGTFPEGGDLEASTRVLNNKEG
jgi:hypothetical protein